MSQYSTEPAGAAAYGTEPIYSTEGSTVTTEDDGSTTTDQVKDQVKEKAQVAQDKARGAVGQARGRISDQVDQRSTEAGERIAGTASDVRSIADELRSQGKDAPAKLAEQVAGQADRVGDYLKGASGDRILRDVEDFARRQPMLVAAAGLALGFAASRFLKASSGRRYESGYQRYDDGDYRPPPPAPTTRGPTTRTPADLRPGGPGDRSLRLRRAEDVMSVPGSWGTPRTCATGRWASCSSSSPSRPPGWSTRSWSWPRPSCGRKASRPAWAPACSAAPARSGWPPLAP